MSAECEIDIRVSKEPLHWHPLPIPAASGAEAAFLGRTRSENHPEFGPLLYLDYESHPALTETAMRDLSREAADQFGCRAIRLHHALGAVGIGEASVLVQAVAGHRAEAFDAARFLIDQLKTRIPIWKREVWEKGSCWAVGAPVTVKGSDS